MAERFLEALEEQARACEALGSPFTARLLRGLGRVWPQDTALARKVAVWQGDLGPRGASVPLRISGGLHALVRAGQAGELAACYPPARCEDAALVQALGGVLRQADSFLCAWCETAPQTNEVGRSAVLLAGAAEVVARYGMPLVLSELGASAGLNLWFDRYALETPDAVLGAADSALRLRPEWRGAQPPRVPLQVAARRGVDLFPLDPRRDGARLLAFVWADQTERLARLQTALGLAAGDAVEGGAVDRGDAADWLEARLRLRHPGQVHLVYHTIAHQYFPKEVQARIAAAMAQAGSAATEEAPLCWLGMEADAGGEGAAVTLRLWPGDVQVTLGRAGFHGQWVAWRGAGDA
ncbi:DUF2332 domain-containing protein [Pseudotabrizicola algicola]|uniref:DUF2332 family protein n=1 Tax=Pseudotabrizicola algicola TaxID=2709381 RepID=A0A6B3RGI4_9RHOB|nr:DUF2332 family protein [Pseudotabrizicola algicola]NEX45164.1 DUF2332 family protein [Pseudotabrizicola algicola]